MSKYPLVTCHFLVEWGGSRIAFSEVSGLSIEHGVVEYRDSSSPEFSVVKMPGMEKFNNIVLKRGIMKGDNEFYQWVNTIRLNQVERRDIVISLLDESHSPVMRWKVKSAWPVKLEGPALKSDVSEAAIETLELAHEGIVIETI
jgi:phage tail-like protein